MPSSKVQKSSKIENKLENWNYEIEITKLKLRNWNYEIEIMELKLKKKLKKLKLRNPSGSTQWALQSSCVANRLAFPPPPPNQNREHPPYSMSKNHLTVKFLPVPRSLSNPQTSASARNEFIRINPFIRIWIPPERRGFSRHPPKWALCASVSPSGQHPNLEASHPHCSNCGPWAGVRPSEQHPWAVFSHPHPSRLGPLATVAKSGQHPYSNVLQAQP